MIVLTLILATLCLTAESKQSSTKKSVSLQSICQDPKAQVTNIPKLIKLIEWYSVKNVEACKTYEDSLLDLKPVLLAARTGKVCNLDMVKLIRTYHDKFITNQATTNIPTSLRNFFMSLCFQISAQCKMSLIIELETSTSEKIKDEDYERIKFLEDYGVSIFEADEKIEDFDDIVLLSDILDEDSLQDPANRMIIKTQTKSILKDLVRDCEIKFRPFYEKLFLPLMQLSNLGYNYQGELLGKELEELKRNKLVRRWYTIVQACETFRAFEIFEDTEGSERVGEGSKVLTFVGPNEAEMLRGKRIESIEDQVSKSNEKPIVYDPEPTKYTELWIRGQEELDSLIKKHNGETTEVDRIRLKMMRKLFVKFKKLLTSGKVILAASELVSCSRSTSDCETSQTDVREDLIRMFDDAVNNREQDEMIEKGIAPLDSAVAGKLRAKAHLGGTRPVNIPKKILYVPTKIDGTKTSTKLYDNTIGRLAPRKSNIFHFFLSILSFLLLTAGFVMMFG